MTGFVIVGGGPAGLFAAELLSAHGLSVALYDRMSSVGRKFLMAGRGGLNLTHSEELALFTSRYADRQEWMERLIGQFPPSALVAWAEGLGQPVFTGSSGRIFPKAMKASPLLRAWLQRLSAQGVTFHLNQSWEGWSDKGALRFRDVAGVVSDVQARAVVLALGGASWPRLGSNAAWVPLLEERGVHVHAFRPANAGFDIAWSPVFRQRFAGTPLQGASYAFGGKRVRGESVVTGYGIEGGAIYALSAALREEIGRSGHADLIVDLRPEMSLQEVRQKLDRPRGGDSLSNHLRKALRLAPVGVNLLREAHGVHLAQDADVLAVQLKRVPVKLTGVQGLERAISAAGGIDVAELDEGLMLTRLPGVHVAGEMIDWEAPTGGYLLQGCFATGFAAAKGVLDRCGIPFKPR